MKRIITLLSSLLLLIACTPYGVTKVNLKKAFRQKTAAKDLYARVDVLPINLPTTVALPEVLRFEATDSLLFLLNDSSEQLVVLDTDGAFVTLISAGAPIEDFSAYGNQILDVLCGNEVKEYNLKDFSLIRTLSLPTDGVTLTELQRRDDAALWFSGGKEGKAYDGEYLFARDYFSMLENPYYTPDECGAFFRCNDSTFFFFSTGQIFAYSPSDFIFVPFTPDFGKYKPMVSAAQMTSDHLYMQMRLREQDMLLVYDRTGKQHRLFQITTEGLTFPLGVIRDGINYYFCPVRRLEEYVLPGTVTHSIDSEYILLKYTL